MNMETDKFSDRSYKDLFSFPRMVEDLLRSFVPLGFVDQINFSTMKKINASFILEEFQQRETDVLWEVEVSGCPAYLYWVWPL